MPSISEDSFKLRVVPLLFRAEHRGVGDVCLTDDPHLGGEPTDTGGEPKVLQP